MTVGERIKQARKLSQLSLRELGVQAGVSAMAISKYERDQDVPSSAVLLRLGNALSVKTDYFFRPAIGMPVQLQAYRKRACLGVKEQAAIQARAQEWLERYLEVESLFPEEILPANLPTYPVSAGEQIETAALQLRQSWALGLDPIENLVQLLEDKGIKVGLIDGPERFDACTLEASGSPVMVAKIGVPGDRQRFNLGHELGHLVLDVQGDLDFEKAAHRFVGAFLVPAEIARFELGARRTALEMNELYLLKQKYGLSMQAWVYRAQDLEIISSQTAKLLFQRFRMYGWRQKEPGESFPSDQPLRMQRLVYRALAEDLISRSRAQELLGQTLQPRWEMEVLRPNGLAGRSGH